MSEQYKNVNPRRYTKEYLTIAVQNSVSYSSLFKYLNISYSGGNYRNIVGWLRYYGINTEHFKGKSWAKGETSETNGSIKRVSKLNSIPDEIVFSENAPPSVSGSKLRRRLLKSACLPYKCSECGSDPVWNNKSLTLDVDHVNGINNDNRINNLRFLCPNCHSQVPTSTSSSNFLKKTRKISHRDTKRKKELCQNCSSNLKAVSSSVCKSCYIKIRKQTCYKIDWPSIENLIKYITNEPYTKVAKKLGVSDTAIRRHLETNGVDPKTLKPF